MSDIERLLLNLDSRIMTAVQSFWQTRERQTAKQHESGRADAGSRGAVTGGAQMNGFLDLVKDLLREAGVADNQVFSSRSLELPGYFRPTKEWDLLVVSQGKLFAVLEAKSQVGPSFGNNFNNRTEEAMGSAVDLWTAYREGALGDAAKPWLGYLFVLEECAKSLSAVSVREPHFAVFPEFVGASYAARYEIFCKKLVRERTYDAAAFVLSDRETRTYREPNSALSVRVLLRSLLAHVLAFQGSVE